MPSAKWTAQNITGLVVSVVTAVALHLFSLELDDATIGTISAAVGWVVGAIFSYFKAETNPAPSSFAHLPPEVAPPLR
jgi:hypothetical protein